MMKTIGLKYCEAQTTQGKVKEIQVYLDGELIGSFEAKGFHQWLGEKVREIGEWLETGNVKKWYPERLKVDKDRLSYVG
jgi:hypothetical protein